MIKGQTSIATVKERQTKHLQHAIDHVGDWWFPANPELLRKIQSGLKDATYPDVDLLLTDIRTDFALFTYCIRELTKLVKRKAISVPDESTPRQLFHAAGMTELKKLFDVQD